LAHFGPELGRNEPGGVLYLEKYSNSAMKVNPRKMRGHFASVPYHWRREFLESKFCFGLHNKIPKTLTISGTYKKPVQRKS